MKLSATFSDRAGRSFSDGLNKTKSRLLQKLSFTLQTSGHWDQSWTWGSPCKVARREKKRGITLLHINFQVEQWFLFPNIQALTKTCSSCSVCWYKPLNVLFYHVYFYAPSSHDEMGKAMTGMRNLVPWISTHKAWCMQTLATVCVCVLGCVSLFLGRLAVTGPKIGCCLIRVFPRHTSSSYLAGCWPPVFPCLLSRLSIPYNFV